MTQPDDDTAGVFRALADPTRRQILQDLKDGELAAGQIASRFAISAPSVSRHLGVLKHAGLITERRDGNRILYSLVEDRLALCVGGFLSAVCPEQIVLRHTKWRSSAQEGPTP
ncbi:metalloregulator ArsR/SmtB family transcription factor [Kitasatospora sp. NPDC097643]|uniref:metalloregulator ArsR/SmtB family transcription factor n=1 Tax=Kitasatospora sp. NPDC097643 TaxID=3157230 RepID=UPI003330A235